MHKSLIHRHTEHGPAGGPPGAARPAAGAGVPASKHQAATALWTRMVQHRVVQWLLGYTAFAYTCLHSAEMLSHTFDWPVITMRLTSDALILGFPLTAALSWYFHRQIDAAAAHATHATAAPPNSIAVLPFIDLSELKDQEYFSDGLSEELIGLLTKISGLRVPARTSSFYFKGKQATIGEIAQALHVAHVLEGSVRKVGNAVRITVQLIQADNGYHLWSENYDRTLDDIFKVQDEIAGAVVHALKVTLLDTQLPARQTTTNAEAYQLYLRGRYHWNRRSAGDFRKAIAYFEQAIASDPGYALAYSGLADCYGLLPIYDRSANAAALARQARQAARKAAGSRRIPARGARVAGPGQLHARLRLEHRQRALPPRDRAERQCFYAASVVRHAAHQYRSTRCGARRAAPRTRVRSAVAAGQPVSRHRPELRPAL